MSDFREEEKLGKAYDAHFTRRLMGYMKPYKGAGVVRADSHARRHAARSLPPASFSPWRWTNTSSR